MRRFFSGVLLSAGVAISFGASPQLLADAQKPLTSHALASLTHGAEWAASRLMAGGKLGAPRVATPAGRRTIGARQDGERSLQGPNRSKPVATVQTDKNDYHPNEQVFITGTNWLARELVELTITEIATDPPGGYTDGPFVYYATSDSHGDIANSDFWTDEHDGGVTFQLVAKGVISGRTAQTTFTDSLGNLDQCANGNPLDPTPCQSGTEWVNGNLGASKSIYFEGDSIPYRLTMSGLALGSHTVTVEWDTTKSGKHALDYITSFNRSVNANPCAGVAGCGSPTTFAIPVDPGLGSVTPVAGNFTMYNGTITAVSAYTLSGTYAGDSSTRITITFTASTASPVLAWGGHIATRLDWGATSSAVAISGSPYHTRLIDIDGSGGNQDRSLSADAVIFPGSIKIIKDANPNGSTPFAFTASPSPLANFSVVDDGTTANTKLFANIINFQTYQVTETPPSGWSFNSIACSVTSANGGSATLNGTSVSIVFKEGENWTCTYTNTLQAAHLIVIKHVINDNGGTKSASDFKLHATGGGATPGNFDGAESPGTDITINAAVGGTSYNVTEDTATGYTPSFSTDCAGTILPSQTKTCTVTNNDNAAHLTLQKTVIKDNGGSALDTAWTLNATGPTSISGTEGQAAVTNAVVSAGTYTLTESNGPSGYTQTNLQCTGATLSGNQITLALGQSATCTFTNDDDAAHLTLQKTVIKDNGGTALDTAWTLNAAGPTPISGTEGQAAVTNAAVNVGTYTLTESNGPSGYTQTNLQCTGATLNGNQITLALGQSATCTFTNDDDAPHLTLQKTVIKDNGGTALDTAWTLNAAGPTPISGTEGQAAVTNAAVSAGTYTLTESNGPSGYTQTNLQCTGATLNGNQITLALGQSATCTFTNDDDAPHLTLQKTVIKDNGGTALDTAWTLNAAGPTPISGTEGQAAVTNAVVSAGTYTLTESNGPSGYTQTNLQCTGATLNGNQITLALGQSATCTFTNDDDAPHLTLQKTVIKDNGGTALDTDWTLNAAGPTPISGTEGQAAVTNAVVSAGTYTLTETNGPTGYTQTNLQCTGATLNGNQITLALGQSATCTFTNDDQPATLVVIKHVVNDNGGTKSASNFTMSVTGANVLPSASFAGAESPGTQVTLNAGSYSVDEVDTFGYTKTLSADCAGTIANGQTKICTVTNEDNKASPGIGTTMSWVLKDSATLTNFRTGASDAGTATMVFTLYGPNALCNTQPIHTETITGIPTAGPFKTPNGWEVTAPGTYRWLVSYSGDKNNNPIASQCGDETHTITVGEPPPQP